MSVPYVHINLSTLHANPVQVFLHLLTTDLHDHAKIRDSPIKYDQISKALFLPTKNIGFLKKILPN